MTAFQRALRLQRRIAGMSQRLLADRVGVDHSYISRLESGNRHPSREIAISISAEMGDDEQRLVLSAGYLPDQAFAVIASGDIESVVAALSVVTELREREGVRDDEEEIATGGSGTGDAESDDSTTGQPIDETASKPGVSLPPGDQRNRTMGGRQPVRAGSRPVAAAAGRTRDAG